MDDCECPETPSSKTFLNLWGGGEELPLVDRLFSDPSKPDELSLTEGGRWSHRVFFMVIRFISGVSGPEGIIRPAAFKFFFKPALALPLKEGLSFR
jgi:hypothetical protein